MSEDLLKADEKQRSEVEMASVSASTERLFDFFKHMTTLSLLTLGGVLSIGGGEFVDVKPLPLAVVVGLVALGGIGAYSGMLEIIEAQGQGEARPKRINFYKHLSSLGFGMGTGAFLSVYILGVLE